MNCPKCNSKLYERQQYCVTEGMCFIAVGCSWCAKEWDRDVLKRELCEATGWDGSVNE